MAKKQPLNSPSNEGRKNDIIFSALKVLCEKGYANATINDIVKKAKCSHGLFYHYFENKKSIFDALIERRGKHIMDFLDEVLKSDDNYVEKLTKLTEYTFANMIKDEIFAYRYYFFLTTAFKKSEAGELPPKIEGRKPPYARMFSFFEEGVKRGDFSSKYSPEDCAKLYNCIIQGATLNFILCPKEFKRNFKFPNIEHIISIFKKEKSNG